MKKSGPFTWEFHLSLPAQICPFGALCYPFIGDVNVAYEEQSLSPSLVKLSDINFTGVERRSQEE